MKKVYTITCHNANNYGSVLQALALQQVLSKKYHATILDYDNSAIFNEYRLFKHRSGFKQQIKQFIKDVASLPQEVVRNKNFKAFRKQYLQTTKTNYYGSKSVINGYPEADAYISGSDQLWNPNITDGLDPIYMLNFGKDDFTKIAYAASVGSNDVIDPHEKLFMSNISKIDFISAREASLQQYLTEHNVNVPLVLDPSMLLSAKEWNGILNLSTKPRQEKYIFVYSWHEPDTLFDIVNYLAKKTGLKIYHYHKNNHKNGFSGKKKSFYGTNPRNFLDLLKNAEYVVTSSFHGTAFSAIFNKKFFVVPNTYSDRLSTLLNSTGLSNRMVKTMADFEKIFQSPIDWKTANSMIAKRRSDSINWLYGAIDKH